MSTLVGTGSNWVSTVLYVIIFVLSVLAVIYLVYRPPPLTAGNDVRDEQEESEKTDEI